MQAHVPYDPIKHKTHQQFLKRSAYHPICTNDSSILQGKFYLDFGTTYIVFYDFNAVWNIDLTISVHQSKFIALSNFEENYCNSRVQTYIFDDFFINCNFSMIKLTRQVPFIAQWTPFDRSEKSVNNSICQWPGLMDLTINQMHRNLEVYKLRPSWAVREKICSPSNRLYIFGNSTTTTMTLGANTLNQRVQNVDALRVQHGQGNCPDMDQTSYTVILTPAIEDHHCTLGHTNIFQPLTKSQLIPSDCFKGDARMTTGMYSMQLIDSHIQNNWKYYSITIDEACYKGTGFQVYFRTATLKQRQISEYKLASNKHHHIFYDYGFSRYFYFYIDRYLVLCTAYIELTTAVHNRNHQSHKHFSFKVSNANEYILN